MIYSEMSKGKPTNSVKITKMRKNAPPPLIPVTYGNFHIAPSPTAAPAEAKIKPNLEVHCSRFCSIRVPPFIYFIIKMYVNPITPERIDAPVLALNTLHQMIHQ